MFGTKLTQEQLDKVVEYVNQDKFDDILFCSLDIISNNVKLSRENFDNVSSAVQAFAATVLTQYINDKLAETSETPNVN